MSLPLCRSSRWRGSARRPRRPHPPSCRRGSGGPVRSRGRRAGSGRRDGDRPGSRRAAAIASATASACWVAKGPCLNGYAADVPGGVDPLQADHPAVLVDADEAVVVVGDAADPPALQARQGDHGVGLDVLAANRSRRRPASNSTGLAPVMTSMLPLRRAACSSAGDAAAEELQGRGFRSDDGDRCVVTGLPAVAQAGPARRAARPSCARRAW